MERLSTESLAVVLKIGRMYITLCTLSRSVIMFYGDERATNVTSIQFPKEWCADETNATIFDRIRSNSNVTS